MWSSQQNIITTGQIHQYRLLHQQNLLTYAKVIDAWQRNQAFQDFFTDLLAQAEFAAYFWETRPLTVTTLEQPFEFVLVNSPQLARTPANPQAFRKYFAIAQRQSLNVATFKNLGGDADLVAPCPAQQNPNYAHLATFMRSASQSQRQELWRALGYAIAHQLNQSPALWVSTSGLGVPWLHIRLDRQPKYYTFAHYRDLP